MLNLTATGILNWDPTSPRVRQRKGFLILRCGDGWHDLYQYYLQRHAEGEWRKVVDEARIINSQFVDRTPHLALMRPEMVRPNWGPHITVIRGEKCSQNQLWGKGEGQELEFTFSPDLRTNGKHWWLPISCSKLHEIRKAMGLNPNPQVPFHMTVGVIPAEGV